MPELPEVEVISNSLNLRLKHLSLLKLEIRDTQRLNSPPFCLLGYKVKKVFRLGKTILIEFHKTKSPSLFLDVHLRMTGKLLFLKHSPDSIRDNLSTNNQNKTKHIRAEFYFDQGQLLFVDPRKFGTFKWHLLLPSLGDNNYDALDAKLSIEKLTLIINGHKKQNIKNFLMNQKRIVGIGNIYASEILFQSRLLPFRTLGELSDKEILRLSKCIKSVLLDAIKNKGTTFSDYQREDGSKGRYQNKLTVYGREGLKCKRCKDLIERTVQSQRSTFYCSNCQK